MFNPGHTQEHQLAGFITTEIACVRGHDHHSALPVTMDLPC
ncbi:hypothetical protein MPQ_0712 [Methylovorus sp. MP688]|nr:hypothetical protein MPQ_0712 [Methylovorus sp. MP688]